MHRTFILFLISLALLSLTAPAGATIIYVSGDQTGTWSADTVIVTAEVRVPPGQSLIIMPGVEVLFSVYCKLIVDSVAILQAVGTQLDSIRFDALLPDSSWHGIRFLSALDSSRLEYCHLTHGRAAGRDHDGRGGAIYCFSSNPTIQHCLINFCSTWIMPGGGYGGGIYCGNNSAPRISSNIISQNTSYLDGGGIYCEHSSPIILDNTINANSAGPGLSFGSGGGIAADSSSAVVSNNLIYDNEADDGGGIYCFTFDSTITGNTISENSAGYGGGIYCFDTNPAITGNTISENSAGYGGGIYCSATNPTISGNAISGNSANVGGGIFCDYSSPGISFNTISGNSAGEGGGLYCVSSFPAISGNIISGNSSDADGGGIYSTYNSSLSLSGNTIRENTALANGGGIYCNESSSPPPAALINCILWDNNPQQIYFGIGGYMQTSYCDIQGGYAGTGNINLDPLFVNPDSGDYHLQSTVGSYHGGLWLPDPLHSPCIDAGDPGSPFALEPMPNGGRINMGFEGNTAEASLSAPASAPPPIAELPREFRLYAPHPNPFNATTVLSYQLPVASRVSLQVYDTAGKLVGTLVSGWRDAGAHQITFDGSGLPSGIYFAKLTAGEYSQVQKLILLK